MDITDMQLFSHKDMPALAEGEVLFFTGEKPLREMLAVLCGVSGIPKPDILPRLLLCDGDDPAMRTAALRAAPDVPILFLTREPACFVPPQAAVRYRILERPFPFDGLIQTLSALLQDSLTAMPPAVKPPYIRVEGSTAVSNGIRVPLTPCEARLLQILTDAYPEAATNDALKKVFTRGGSNTVSVYVTYLRKKLRALPAFQGILSLHGGSFALVLHTPASNTETK